jgi:ATP-dependent DNA helicase RecG
MQRTADCYLASRMGSLNLTGETTLERFEPHRLAALVLEDLQRYPESAISDIHQRIDGEIHSKQAKRAL